MRGGIKILKKTLGLLTAKEKKKLLMLSLVTMLLSLVELIGVVFIFPFMSVATNPKVIETNQYLNLAYQKVGFQSETAFLVALGVLAILSLVVGNSFKALSTYLLLRFGNMQNHYLSKRMLGSYLSRPYEYYLNQNSSDLIKNVVSEVNVVVSGVLTPLLNAVGRIFAAFFVIVTLVLIDPILAILVAFVVATSYFIIYQMFKKKISKMGRSRTKENKKRIRIISEASGGIKHIKLMNKEFVYLNDFERPSKKYALSKTFEKVIGDIPKLFLEVIAYGGILLVVIYLVTSYENRGDAIAMTSLYAVAAYKLMPAFQKIYKAITSIKFSVSALDAVAKNMTFFSTTIIRRKSNERMSFDSTLELRDVDFSYLNAKNKALTGVNLKICANNMVGIIGSTGSGKTTLVDIILGLLSPSHGEIYVDGNLLTQDNIHQWQANIGYVPQHIYLSDATVAENIAFGLPLNEINEDCLVRAAKLAQIHDFITNELESGYQSLVGERGVRLSGGQRQRIGIARALYNDPSFLVFDEATSALDMKTEGEVMKSIEGLGGKKTILMIAHRLSTLKKCDVVIELEKGIVKSKSVNHI